MQKRWYFSLALLLSSSISLLAQQLHSPKELFEIMDKSKLVYTFSELENPVLPEDRNMKLNFNTVYQVTESDRIATYQYDLKEEAKEVLERAEAYFQDGEYLQARAAYLEVLEIDPKYYKVMTYIGQTYGIEKDFGKAMKWYKKTIKLNPIDYMAHWFLADVYFVKGNLNKAVEEITTAKILNRNNPRIQQSLEMIYAKKKLSTENWDFVPQVAIDSLDSVGVQVAAAPGWVGYAIAKAVWQYEPGYPQSMGVEPGNLTTIEERECLLGLLLAADDEELGDDPIVKTLVAAVGEKTLDAYILYEVMLPQYPAIAYQLTENQIKRIRDYIIKVRSKP